jgi:hypothetical protein
MALDLAPIYADVAARLRLPTSAEAEAAVNMAVQYIVLDIGVPAADLPDTADDPLLAEQGVPLLAIRIFNDTSTKSQVQNDFDAVFTGTSTPSTLYKNIEQYWSHLRVNWGIS